MDRHVFVAMSGGVDSTVAALLLLKAGWQVSGIHLKILPEKTGRTDSEQAALEKTCRQLAIPLHYLPVETEFQDQIIAYFCEEYRQGRTPNPCIRCNRQIKFGLLLDKIKELGGNKLATGHYARIEIENGRCHLLKGLDGHKDQSYFLHVLNQRILADTLFPLGRLHKSEVKELAKAAGLPQAEHRESQDICFIPSNNQKAFLAERIPVKPGEIVDSRGNLLGTHQGLAFYTVGQRQGMGVSSSRRLYVIEIDAVANRIVVGGLEELCRSELVAGDINWIAGEPPDDKTAITVKVRYRAGECPAQVVMQGDKAHIRFATPQKGLAPGQSAVFYCGDEVLGGGVIETSR